MFNLGSSVFLNVTLLKVENMEISDTQGQAFSLTIEMFLCSNWTRLYESIQKVKARNFLSMSQRAFCLDQLISLRNIHTLYLSVKCNEGQYLEESFVLKIKRWYILDWHLNSNCTKIWVKLIIVEAPRWLQDETRGTVACWATQW